MRVRRQATAGIAATAAAALVLTLPAGASAAFHLVMVREVFAGGANSDFIEVQMPSAGENFIAGHEIDVYNASGTLVDTITPNESADSGQSQRTILFGDTGVEAAFGVAPDFLDADVALNPAGGAVCWRDGQPPDCVAWGNFSGTALPSPAGSPVSAGGIPDGMSITRSIARGCATLLERNADDTNDSAADFAVTTPTPRPNSVAPTEMPCPAVPNTMINTRPPNPNNSNDATFTYSATPATGASFQCSLDSAAFAACPAAGITYMALADGEHNFQVRAMNSAGTDPSPASYTWTIDTSLPSPPDTTITAGPSGRTKDRTPTFRFRSDQTGVTFQCKLDTKPYRACTSPFTTARLAFGKHTLQVRAVGAGGPDATPARRAFKVIRRR
jgi:hypothetical protein